MAFRFRPASRLLPAAAGLLLAVAPLAPALAPALAQGIPFNEVRALNLARNAAVLSNGGLTVYTPANCMFTTSAASNPCLVRSDADGFVYRFLGGPPGWEAKGLPATTETEIQIAPDGRRVVAILYNGPPRSR
ncbi:hypothetical protein [Cyanobium gracile]|uniref:Uncharacterized protein n=1 Tax=Cyanobium gracile (strain ATCC 27147 / PCC 6307) TaxID=292564 RepID=K9P5K4_CYAGP|nr:hypothetical protein [Cyanobium gracile]AFY28278.1 hypothetical protein Cyagr_1097 [Cyanobium gracile PCC 6307]